MVEVEEEVEGIAGGVDAVCEVEVEVEVGVEVEAEAEGIDGGVLDVCEAAVVNPGGMGGKSNPAICGGIGGINNSSTGIVLDPAPEIAAEDIAPEEETPPVADADGCGNVVICEAPGEFGCC